jgi:energy-coupling factor transporter ATP-binding protein EcfA2
VTSLAEPGWIECRRAMRAAVENLQEFLVGGPVTPLAPLDVEQTRVCCREIALRLDEMDAAPALLTVVLLGGTGVGKSTLLNALAGARIAESGIVRPTTQFPTMYHHADVPVDALPAPFSACRSAPHERPELRFKVLIDTPDMDGAIVEHHARLREILPAADVVLYVGSGEKYHDRAAWEILLEQSSTRGFAFVLNKWDRCLAAHDESTGAPPDEDFLLSLRQAGFVEPLLFRVCGRQWEARRVDGKQDFELIPDDFERLAAWLEAELDERTIRDIKARGVVGQLDRIDELLARTTPPDWRRKVEVLRGRWEQSLRESLSERAKLLVEAADRQSAELERHFGRIGRRGVRGLFGFYLRVVDRLADLQGMLAPVRQETQQTQMRRIAARCLESIPAAMRRTHREALRRRLLALADREGWPIDALSHAADEEGGEADSPLADSVLVGALADALEGMDKDYTAPEGGRRLLQLAVRLLCYWLPLVVLAVVGSALVYSVWNWSLWGVGEWISAALVLALTFAGLHILLAWAFPVKWESLRMRLLNRVEDGLLRRMAPAYMRELDQLADRLSAERQRLIHLREAFQEVRDRIRRSDGQSAEAMFSRFRGPRK